MFGDALRTCDCMRVKAGMRSRVAQAGRQAAQMMMTTGMSWSSTDIVSGSKYDWLLKRWQTPTFEITRSWTKGLEEKFEIITLFWTRASVLDLGNSSLTKKSLISRFAYFVFLMFSGTSGGLPQQMSSRGLCAERISCQNAISWFEDLYFLLQKALRNFSSDTLGSTHREFLKLSC